MPKKTIIELEDKSKIAEYYKWCIENYEFLRDGMKIERGRLVLHFQGKKVRHFEVHKYPNGQNTSVSQT